MKLRVGGLNPKVGPAKQYDFYPKDVEKYCALLGGEYESPSPWRCVCRIRGLQGTIKLVSDKDDGWFHVGVTFVHRGIDYRYYTWFEELIRVKAGSLFRVVVVPAGWRAYFINSDGVVDLELEHMDGKGVRIESRVGPISEVWI